MKKVCEYQGYYIEYDEETGDEDVLKCKLFTNEGDWEEYCYCDEEERNNCMLYKYSKYIEEKDKEIERLIISLQAQEELTMNEHIKVERLNNIIEKLEQENAVLKTQVVNKDKYSYGIRMGSDKE